MNKYKIRIGITVLLILVNIFFCGCEKKEKVTPEEYQKLQNKIENAQKNYEALIERTKEANREETVQKYYSDIDKLVNEKNKLTQDINELKKEIEFAQAEQEKRIFYILTVRLKQSHFSLSPSKHIKDAMNAIEFQIPVSKEYFESLTEGQEILEKFRSGSFLMEGSFGDWKVTVLKKEIRIKEKKNEK